MSLRERSGQAFSGREKKEGDGERRKQEGSIRADPDPAERWKKGEERISWGKVNRMVSLEERSGFHTEFGLRARPGEHLYQQNQCTSVEYQQLLDQIRQSEYTQSCEVAFGRVWHAHPCPRPHRKPWERWPLKEPESQKAEDVFILAVRYQFHIMLPL